MKPRQNDWYVFHRLGDVPPGITSFLKNAAHGSLYQAPDWNHLVERTDTKSIVLCALREKTPLFGALVLKSPIPGTRYFGGTVRRGPVFDTLSDALSLWHEFEAKLHHEGAVALTIFPYWEHQASARLLAYLDDHNYRPIDRTGAYRFTATIDLSRPEEEIFQGLGREGRSEIRRAIRKGVQVRHADKPEDWHLLWEITRETCGRKGIPAPSVEKVRAMEEYARVHPLHCACMISHVNGCTTGATAVLRHGSRVIPEIGGVSSIPIPGVPKSLPVLWEAVRWARQTGASVFDVGGIAPHAAEGSDFWRINVFKRQLARNTVELFTPMQKVLNPSLHHAHGLLRKAKHRLRPRRAGVGAQGS